MFHRPIAAHRLFFAIRPPLVLARQIADAASWFDPPGQPLRPEHLHVTLDILDDRDSVSGAFETVLKEVGDAVGAAPFAIAFDMAGGSARSVALRPRRKSPGVEDLRRRIVAARQATGIAERADYRFAPHMTLGYRDGAPFSQPIAPVGWTVDEFMLVHSHVGRMRHDIVGRWALAGADAQLALL